MKVEEIKAEVDKHKPPKNLSLASNMDVSSNQMRKLSSGI
jgi:hypothetical protein